MGYIDEGLDEVKRATPTSGVNVCIYDDFEDIGNKLEVIANFDTIEESQNFIDSYDGDAELVMYEADESTEYRAIGEKLNKDGTGVRRATRGLNPKKTKAKSLTFVYVSKSECDICRQYDGKTFATDSPDRPIIPRLESQGKKGTRPYTHPNCKCKWVKPFSDAYMKNFDEIGMKDSDNINFLKTSNEAGNYAKVKSKLYKRAVAKYGKKFFNLPKSRKHYIIMQEIMKELKSHESFQPINLLKTSYNAIEPTLNLDRMRHIHSNEVRVLIDEMVGESLTSERKHDIVLEHNLDFTFENLLDLTAVALFEALNEEEKIGMDVELEFTDDEEKAKDTVEDHLDEDPEHYSRLKSVFEHDVWDEEKNKLVDPSLLEDKEDEEATEGGSELWAKASENDLQLELDIVQKYEGSTMQVKNNMAQNMGFKNWKEMIGKLKMRVKLDENGDTFEELSDAERNAWLNIFELDPNTSSLYESKANEGGRGSGRKGHQKWMLGAEADPEECPHCMIFTEKKNGNCQICGNSY